jgi:hypothetical protein
MADQPEDPPARRGAGSDDPDQPLDRTAPFDPVAEDEGADAADRTQRLPDDPDRTARIAPPAGDRTARMAPTDRAGGAPPPDDRTTRIQPGPRNATPPGEPAWAGRAGIPVPGGPGEPPDDGPPGDWQQGPPDGGRRWWMPILIGVIALVLLGVLAFGLWLILRGDGETPAPAPTRTTPTATTAAPTTPPPTSSPSPTATTPAPVPVPIVEGLTVEEAAQRLSDAGLSARLNYVDSDRPAGTVVGSNPGPGARVEPGSTVTLNVSSGPTTPPATSSPTLTPTTSPSIPPGP